MMDEFAIIYLRENRSKKKATTTNLLYLENSRQSSDDNEKCYVVKNSRNKQYSDINRYI